MNRAQTALLTAAVALAAATPLHADTPVEWSGSFTATAGDGDFAPYYNSALTAGRISSAGNAIVEASVLKKPDLASRFSWGAGVDIAGGWTSQVDYDRYEQATSTWTQHPVHPSRFWIQQLYGEVKYRGVFLTAGLKEHAPAFVNAKLSSGDLVYSGNSRPIPEIRAGFIDFQDIPFTRGWVQIQGEVAYGKMTDSHWWADMYNRYNYHIAKGEYYNYKRCYFRVAERQRFAVTLGMQAACTFGGSTEWLEQGKVTRTAKRKVKAADIIKMLIPTPSSSEDFYEGNHLGTWDFMARFNVNATHQVKAYFSWPWEDGSGIGRRNGWDGLWGVEYARRDGGTPLLGGAVIEFLDFTNQSGPIHFAPGDNPGTTVPGEATGADDYYNNAYYNPYAAYGLSIGSPMLMAPFYNRDGYPAYIANRMRGFHAAATGHIIPSLAYRVAVGYRKAWGNGKIILPRPIHDTSAMIELDYRPAVAEGLAIKGSLAIDRGNMPGNTFGAMITVSYSGIFNLASSK